MCSNSPCQIGAKTSKRFSERIVSVSNLIFDMHHIRWDQNNIDKMIVLRMNKRFMKIVRVKEAFTSIMFHDVLSNKYTSTNEEWNY